VPSTGRVLASPLVNDDVLFAGVPTFVKDLIDVEGMVRSEVPDCGRQM
jgi:hypothetical protein